MNIRIKLAILCVLLVPPCLYFVISKLEYNEMPNLHRYWQQEHATLFDSQQEHVTSFDSQQGHATTVNSHQRHSRTPVEGHATPLEKHEGTYHDVSAKKSKFELPQFVIDHVKTFVFFVGFGHSGHSIVASLMDSHPHVVISHELNLFWLLSQKKIRPSRHDIFNAIWKNSKQTISNGERAVNQKGYNLLVNGLYQGKYIDYIDVIGDKKGGVTTDMLMNQPKDWSSSCDTLKSLNLTLKVILVLRNPYDTIASTILVSKCYKNFSNIKEFNITQKISPKKINFAIKKYFIRHNAIVNAKKKYNLDIIEIHGKDLVFDPRGTILKLCDHIRVNCSNDYLEICENKIYKAEARTRQYMEWPDEQLKRVQQNIEKYDNLMGYTFDSP